MKTTSRPLPRLALALCALIGGLLPVTSAAAGSYPPTSPPDPPVPGILDPDVIISPSTVVAGTNFTATVTPCVRGTLVPMTFEGVTVEALCTNPAAKATFRAPSMPGSYILTVESYVKTISVQINVVAGSGGSVPSTGIGTLSTFLTIGVATLSTGLGLYIVSRRRTRMRLAG